MNSQVLASEIYIATALAPGHPVFRIDGFGDDNGKIDSLVIKQEVRESAANVRAAAAIMTAVDRNARTVVLTPMEISQLKLWADGSELPNVEALRTANDISGQLSKPGAWVKMPVKKLLMLDSAVNKRLDADNADKADVRLIARALKKHGGLEKLGEIIAADLFNGNDDRFGPPFSLNSGPGPGGIVLNAIYNVGNVFIACDGNGKGSPIGLDSYAPSGDTKDIHNAYVDPKQFGGMLLLPDKKAEKEIYAGLIIEDLERLLGPRNRKIPLGTQKRLGNARKKRVRRGMETGAKKLKKYLRSWTRNNPQNPHRATIATKMSLLGW